MAETSEQVSVLGKWSSALTDLQRIWRGLSEDLNLVQTAPKLDLMSTAAIIQQSKWMLPLTSKLFPSLSLSKRYHTLGSVPMVPTLYLFKRD